MKAKITRRIPYTNVVIHVYDTESKQELSCNRKIPYYTSDSKEFRKYIEDLLTEHEHILSVDIAGTGTYAVAMPVEDFLSNGEILEDKENETD